jgi:hypothetical protein
MWIFLFCSHMRRLDLATRLGSKSPAALMVTMAGEGSCTTVLRGWLRAAGGDIAVAYGPLARLSQLDHDFGNFVSSRRQ